MHDHRADLTPLAPEMTHTITNRLWLRVGSQVRDLQIGVCDGGLVLHGRVDTYYAKQLVQQVVCEVSGQTVLSNEIDVR